MAKKCCGSCGDHGCICSDTCIVHSLSLGIPSCDSYIVVWQVFLQSFRQSCAIGAECSTLAVSSFLLRMT